MTFNVNVIDPCDSTVLSPVFPGATTVTNGTPDSSVTFNEATDSVETTYGGNNNYCGTRSYRVYRVVSGGPDVEVTGDWMTIVNNHDGTYTIDINPLDDSLALLAQPLELRAEIRLTDQPNHVGTGHDGKGLDETWSVTYLPAACNCDLLTWDVPLANIAAAPTLTVGVTFSN